MQMIEENIQCSADGFSEPPKGSRQQRKGVGEDEL